jgi:hypothetical protein
MVSAQADAQCSALRGDVERSPQAIDKPEISAGHHQQKGWMTSSFKTAYKCQMKDLTRQARGLGRAVQLSHIIEREENRPTGL